MKRSVIVCFLLGQAVMPPAMAFMEPSIKRLEGCYERFTWKGEDINKYAPGGTFFINEFQPASRSTDARMLKTNGLSGFISITRLYRASPPVPDSSQLLFTGVLYKRHSSLLENLFSRSDDKMFYEVIHEKQRYIIRKIYLKLPVSVNCD
ncbi:hypothetical protein [Parendozoicomonas sp. Alg238-R29]|uniref:hypothetical protein n=1 Tax=Parendozoicomonas sp. Alg238-R29 TaxID=2993446 RepID=UPI00248F1847|nr:hypothetical protein [Parendozoicomonas sp. Alg238-R29]